MFTTKHVACISNKHVILKMNMKKVVVTFEQTPCVQN